MKIEYDVKRDLLYLWLGPEGTKAAQTMAVTPGVHTDFDRDGRLIGLEVLDATDVLGETLQLEVDLPDSELPEATGRGRSCAERIRNAAREP